MRGIAARAPDTGADRHASHAQTLTLAHRGDPGFSALFVVLWSTGFIAAKYGLPHATPFAFLFTRFCLVGALMAIVAAILRPAWPSRRDALHTVVVGLLIQGGYLGGVFFAISRGTSAGTSAMLVGLQPVLTVVLARGWLGERIVMRQWLGLVIWLAGVALVVGHKIDIGSVAGIVALLVALVAISVGTLYQKHYCGRVDIRSGAVIQFGASALAYLPLVLFAEDARIEWTPAFMFAIGWSVIVLSAGANLLLFWLLRRGRAADVAALFFLVPAVTAMMAWGLFGEHLTAQAIGGMLLIATGVTLGRAPRSAAAVAPD
ncbi:MAG: DMT family transporter [Casimicrobiaceae bacterium]